MNGVEGSQSPRLQAGCLAEDVTVDLEQIEARQDFLCALLCRRMRRSAERR